jgi:hypothetical protein
MKEETSAWQKRDDGLPSGCNGGVHGYGGKSGVPNEGAQWRLLEHQKTDMGAIVRMQSAAMVGPSIS